MAPKRDVHGGRGFIIKGRRLLPSGHGEGCAEKEDGVLFNTLSLSITTPAECKVLINKLSSSIKTLCDSSGFD